MPDATGSDIASKLKSTSAEAEFGLLVNAANVLREGLPPPEPAVITSVTPLPGASAEVTWEYPSAVRPNAFEVHWRVVEEPSEEDACFLPQIYGADGRKDFYQINQINPLATQLADASVALFMNPNFIQRDSNGPSIYDQIIYGNYYNFVNPFFGHSPLGPTAQGFAGPDLVATAGHCIESLPPVRRSRLPLDTGWTQLTRRGRPFQPTMCTVALNLSLNITKPAGARLRLVRLDREVVGHTLPNPARL